MGLFTRLSMKSQLLILFLMLTLPILILNWYGNEKAEEILKKHVTSAYVELIKQNHSIIERDIDTIHRIMTAIIQNPLTQSFLQESPETAEATTKERIARYVEMDELLRSHSMGINELGFIKYSYFVPDPHDDYSFASGYRDTNQSFVYFVSDEERPDWYEEAVRLKGKGYLTVIDQFGPQAGKTLAYIRAVNPITAGNVAGVLVATNLDKKIGASVESVSLPEGDIYLTGMDHTLYYGTNHHEIDHALGRKLEVPLLKTVHSAPGNVEYAIQNDHIYVMHYHYALYQKLVYMIPTRSLVQQQNELKQSIGLISGVYFFLCFLVILYFLRSLIQPLLKMVTFFKLFEPGKTVPAIEGLHRRDEVGGLVSSIHDMAQRLNQLVNEKYIMEIKQKEAELHLLYEQINPHLLYNTLESIYWKCSLQGDSEAAEMIKDLSKLMRISLSQGKDLISLREELEHAKAYINLQQKRYDYEFQVEWRLDESLFHIMIPKVSLQPIIENAILHGVRHMGEDGRIAISVFRDGESAIVEIEDNGYKPADLDLMRRILADDQGKFSSGYGARNVHKRIRLHFGDQYGLVYMRGSGQGTCARLVLPAGELSLMKEE